MIVVTGGAGFIGANIIKQLNKQGHVDILVVDDLTDGSKFFNLQNLEIQDYMDKTEFLALIKTDNLYEKYKNIKTIFHQGACSTTTEWDGRYMMENNYSYSKDLLHYCIKYNINFIYASSAAVYGNNTVFSESRKNEQPINVYGYSKFLFDCYVRDLWKQHEIEDTKESLPQIVGLRYFNVYGPGEAHKGSMASVAFHLNNQMKKTGKVQLFEGSDGYGNGEQRRDFVYIDDIININLWFMNNPDRIGIYNAGTGQSEPFNNIAKAVLAWYKKNKGQEGSLGYIPFPEHLKNHYQSFTEANIELLQRVGYNQKFHTVQEGVFKYLDALV